MGKRVWVRAFRKHLDCLLPGVLFPEDGYISAPFLKSALLKIPRVVHPKTETKKTVAPFPRRAEYSLEFVWGLFQKQCFAGWQIGWKNNRQVFFVYLNWALHLLPLPLCSSRETRVFNTMAWRKKSLVQNTTFLRFVYSCASLAYDAVKIRGFSLCLVQGKMSCFSPVPWS